jgi:UDP-glucose 4-epimerase
MSGNNAIERILVVGASGYIGANLSLSLAHNGYDVTALCYPEIPLDDYWKIEIGKVILGDLRSDEFLEDITNQSYDLVIYLVSLNDKDSNREPEYVNSINVLPVWKILELFEKKRTLKQFIYFSTIHVYGDVLDKMIDETSSTSPVSAYGLTHKMAEEICNMYNERGVIKCVNVRLSNSYGSPAISNKHCWSLVINNFCLSAHRSKSIVIKSDGLGLRDFIHSSDIAIGINKIMTSQLTPFNNLYNLSSGSTISLFQLASHVRSAYQVRYNEEIPIKVLGVSDHKNTNPATPYVISNKKLLSLGFDVQMQINDGVNELFEYLDQNEVR